MHANHSQPWVGFSLKAEFDVAGAIVQHHHLVPALRLLHRCSLQRVLLLPQPPPSGLSHQCCHSAARSGTSFVILHALLLPLRLLLLCWAVLPGKTVPAITATRRPGKCYDSPDARIASITKRRTCW
eukprot:GHRQ01031047.1.p1 GENE.GHRQ01031047.1~~GHRQ01031047.1.p1  ORF type:complete len:127 (-),score=26.45 GHRQ01031047.1:465-845(-)